MGATMGKETRNVVLSICGFAILASLAAYAATGAAFFTRFPSDEIAEANESAGLGDLFGEETGLSEELGELEAVDNRFTMGLLPSGAGRDALSVMTVSGIACVAALGAFFWERRSSFRGVAPDGGADAGASDQTVHGGGLNTYQGEQA